MEIKKIFGSLFLFTGAISLVAGILGIFEQTQIWNINPWAFAILGLFFFSSGVSLVKSIRKQKAN